MSDGSYARRFRTSREILLLGSATARFEEIDNSSRALYDLFQVHTLSRLTPEGCATLWTSVSGRDIDVRVVRSLQILTGGNPRLLVIVAQFGAQLSFRELMGDLLNLVDEHTEYFRSHLESLGTQERRVYLGTCGSVETGNRQAGLRSCKDPDQPMQFTGWVALSNVVQWCDQAALGIVVSTTWPSECTTSTTCCELAGVPTA